MIVAKKTTVIKPKSSAIPKKKISSKGRPAELKAWKWSLKLEKVWCCKVANTCKIEKKSIGGL